jgi:hypothetical protein
MITLDPSDERQRLARLYAGMGPDELRELARSAAALTDLAKQVLRAELSRRKLDIELQDSVAPPSEIELRRLVTIRQFQMLPDALLAKGILESAGIECFLGDDVLIRMDWLWSNLLGGVKLRVKPEDIEVATRLLDEEAAPNLEVAAAGDYDRLACPHCGSLDVSFKDLNAFGNPIFADDSGWECLSCGRRWQEREDKSA